MEYHLHTYFPVRCLVSPTPPGVEICALGVRLDCCSFCSASVVPHARDLLAAAEREPICGFVKYLGSMFLYALLFGERKAGSFDTVGVLFHLPLAVAKGLFYGNQLGFFPAGAGYSPYPFTVIPLMTSVRGFLGAFLYVVAAIYQLPGRAGGGAECQQDGCDSHRERRPSRYVVSGMLIGRASICARRCLQRRSGS